MRDETSSNIGDLTKVFDDKRQMPTGETLDQIRQNYFIAAQMNGSDDKSVGGLNINTSGRRDNITLEREKKKLGDQILMAMASDSLARLEESLIAKYGEDFAENWAAELLDKDVYGRLMQIKDQDERRSEIARAIQNGVKDGTISTGDLDKTPDIQDWVNARIHQDVLSVNPDKQTFDTEHKLSQGAEELAFDEIFKDTGGPTR